MRWTSSVLNLSVAPMLKLTGGLLSCPLLHGGDRLHGASKRFLAHERFRCQCERGGRGRGLLFRETLLEDFHQINHRSHMWLGYFNYFLTLELCSDHNAHIFLVFVAILFQRKRSRQAL